MASPTPHDRFPPTALEILVVDLTGYAGGFRTRSDAETASFLQAYYRLVDEHVGGRGGRVVKFIGDAVLAVFPPDEVPAAVDAVVALERAVRALARQEGLDCRMGANLNVGDVIAADFGVGEARRPDVVGRVVNQTSLLGRGEGIRLGERAYRTLPSDHRTPRKKRKGPVVYELRA